MALLLSFALVAAACGSDDDGSDEAAPSTTEGDDEAGGDSFVTLDQACADAGGLEAPDGFRVNLITDIGKVDDGTFN
ncbi:MAG: hypothetical protein OES57_16220, partial [Acidimicrobiia bacterium]|nr:hypothetical protein [Acidimicrobiia bacterium]